jgi:type I restriction enzyme S subunit
MSGVSLQRYAAYKDSRVDWIGELPSNWEVYHLKNSVKIKITDGPHETPVFTDDGIPFISAEAIQNGAINFDSKRGYISHETNRLLKLKCHPRKNDIFIVKSGSTTGKIGYVTTNLDFNIWSPLALVRVSSENFPRYLFYFLSSSCFQKQIQMYWSFGTQPNIGMKVLENLQVIAPPLLEQTAIANYLDEKTAHIDRKIDLLKQKAARYAELKQTFINETVTRGLDQSVAMKDSGVEWIGQVPAHWEICRIDHIAKQQRIKNIGMREKNLLSLSYGKLKRKNIDSAFGLLPESFETYQIINPGNIILRLTDLQNDWTSLRVGLARERGIITSAYLCLCFTKQINPIFAYYLLHLYDLSKVFYWQGNGLRQTMKFDDIKLLPFAFPSYEEQTAIATYLDEKIAHIDRIITNIRAQIEQLQALRKVLINEVVTGKIRVCA